MSSAAAVEIPGGRRSPALAGLSAHLPPPYLVLPPTTKFPGIAVAHGDFGLCAVVTYDEMAMHDEETGAWWAASVTLDPERIAAQAALDLAAAARAPAERVTALVWLTKGLSHAPPPDGVCAGPDAEMAAYMVQKLMARRLVGSSEPVSPWLGAYAEAALGPKDPVPRSLRRLSQLIERCLRAEFGDRPAVIETIEIPPQDFADPRFLLPAVLAAAHEDLAILHALPQARKGKVVTKPAFRLDLAVDPGAFLGYRVANVTPSHPFFVLDPVVALARRYRYHNEYLFDDVMAQFGRFLMKNGLDATVVDEAARQITTRGGDAE